MRGIRSDSLWKNFAFGEGNKQKGCLQALASERKQEKEKEKILHNEKRPTFPLPLPIQ